MSEEGKATFEQVLETVLATEDVYTIETMGWTIEEFYLVAKSKEVDVDIEMPPPDENMN